MPTTRERSATLRVRRSRERAFEDFGWTDNRITFSFGEYQDPEWVHFGPLRVIVENHIQPRSGFQAHSHRDVEIITYVSAGTLTHEDSFGHQAGVTAGEMQHISAGSGGMTHSERNIHDELEHNLQIWFIPDHGRRRFCITSSSTRPKSGKGGCVSTSRPMDAMAACRSTPTPSSTPASSRRAIGWRTRSLP